MAGEVETRGQVARTMAGAEGVEIKATIAADQVEQALAFYGLQVDENERYIYFFDTPDLTLFEQGVILRARRIVGYQHDSTIKFRPVDPATVPAMWRKNSGFKIEADCNDKVVTKSASLTMPVARGLIKRVAAGKDPIASLFTEQQLLFLLSMANKKIDYPNVIVMGPIRAWRWKYNDPALPWPLTGELWRRDDGSQMFEVSIKAPVVQAPAASAGFMAFLAEVGAVRDNSGQAKTRWALAHAVEHYRRSQAETPAPVPATAVPASAS